MSESGETAASGERPPRRKRYGGKYPRRFDEKYKEHDPERFAETVAKVIASGKTPAGTHVPVMVAECLEALRLIPGAVGVDATLGYGGHAGKILERISPGGFLVGLDVDPIEQPKTLARLRGMGHGEDCFAAVRSNYAGIRKALDGLGMDGADFILADLGCSSMQYDDPGRGFSFKHSGALDMRMNPQRGIPAADWLERAGVEKLAGVLVDHADEPRAGRLAELLAGKRFSTTTELGKTIRAHVSELDEDEADLTVRRVFQAIRIAVNEEFTALDAFLRVAPECLRPGGRMVILTFHSGEDRRVKKALQAGLRDGVYSSISDAVGIASHEERRLNPRSIPAKMRWAERTRGA